MASEFKLPKLGENAESGTLVKILADVGETIEVGQIVLELETDKAVLEVESTIGGKIGDILVSEGDTIKADQPIFKIEEVATEASAPKEAAAPIQAKAPTPEKSVVAAQAPGRDGLGQAPSEGPALQSSSNGAISPVAASPSVRRLAREMGVQIEQIQGSGPGSRISDSDLKNYSRQVLQGESAPASTASPGITPTSAPLPDFASQGEIETQKLSNVRRATANQMNRAWTIPHVTQFDKADITDLEKLRKQFGPRAEKAGGKLTPTAILIKAVVGALRRFPQFNSSLDLANDELILKKFINIGIAVDTDRGLLVPVIRDADKKSVIGLAVEMSAMAERARNKKTGIDEMSGGTFTITNLGGIGGTNFTPIINTPEVAILGVSRAAMEPVWNAETSEFEPRLMMPLALSYDHRVIDGADAARFLRFICELLEDPFLLALEG